MIWLVGEIFFEAAGSDVTLFKLEKGNDVRKREGYAQKVNAYVSLKTCKYSFYFFRISVFSWIETTSKCDYFRKHESYFSRELILTRLFLYYSRSRMCFWFSVKGLFREGVCDFVVLLTIYDVARFETVFIYFYLLKTRSNFIQMTPSW